MINLSGKWLLDNIDLERQSYLMAHTTDLAKPCEWNLVGNTIQKPSTIVLACNHKLLWPMVWVYFFNWSCKIMCYLPDWSLCMLRKQMCLSGHLQQGWASHPNRWMYLKMSSQLFNISVCMCEFFLRILFIWYECF